MNTHLPPDTPSGGIPAPVHRLLMQHIDSVEQLEVLLLLKQAPEVEWTPAAIASILNGHPVSIAARLEALERARMIRRAPTSDVRYRYAPASTESAAAIEGLAQAYRERRVAVISLIASKPLENVRAFSDAFLFKKPEGS